MFQFSLRSLLIAMAVFAVGTAALLSANHWWSSLIWGVALAMLVIAGLMALYRREATRAFWIGFLLTGVLYLGLLMRSVPNVNGFGGYAPLSYDYLVTTKVIVAGYYLFPSSRTSQWIPAAGTGMGGPGGGPVLMGGMGGSPAMGGYMAPGGMGMGGGGPMGGGMGGMAGGFGAPMNPNPAYLDLESFTSIGHALWTLLISWLGGTAAFWIFSTRDKRPAAGTEPARNTP
jgi:hypothetical protein